MILNNYWAWKYAIERNTYYGYNQAGSETVRNTTIKGTNGSYLSMMANLGISTGEGPTNIKLASYISHSVSDDTAETNVEDYSVGEFSNISNMGVSVAYNNSDNAMKYIFTCTGTNNNSDPITIRKIGLKKGLYTFANSYVRNYFLFAIIDLEEPIIVPAGQGYSITVDMTEQ